MELNYEPLLPSALKIMTLIRTHVVTLSGVLFLALYEELSRIQCVKLRSSHDRKS